MGTTPLRVAEEDEDEGEADSHQEGEDEDEVAYRISGTLPSTTGQKVRIDPLIHSVYHGSFIFVFADFTRHRQLQSTGVKYERVQQSK